MDEVLFKLTEALGASLLAGLVAALAWAMLSVLLSLVQRYLDWNQGSRARDRVKRLRRVLLLVSAGTLVYTA
jgi:hypothetical protein